MFYECEGPCIIDRSDNGTVHLTWTLEGRCTFSLELPKAMFESSHMQATWSLRFHHDDPDAAISCRLRVKAVVCLDPDDRFRVTFRDTPTPLLLPATETDAIEGLSAHYIEACWLELVELP